MKYMYSETIILKNKRESYFLKYIKNNHIIKELYMINSDNVLFKILNKLNIHILGKWKWKIKDYNKYIIFDTLYNEKISKIIKRKNKQSQIILFFWNKINAQNRVYLKDKNIDEFWTFDKDDSEKYNIKLNSQFYTKEIKLKNSYITNDVLFLGRAKNRKEKILNLEKKFKEKQLKSEIFIIENEKNFISYEKYLDMLTSSNAILDIVDGEQTRINFKMYGSFIF